MNILFSTGHPAQIHNFRVVREVLKKHGHHVYWLATQKDISDYLLNAYCIKYTKLKRPQKGMLSKAITLLQNAWITAKIIHRNKIDIVVSRVNPGVVLAAYLMRKKQIALSDTEAAGIYESVFSKLVGAFITSKSYERTLRKDQIRIEANIELFYLHKKYFKPNRREVYQLLGISGGTAFVIARFVSGTAFHDAGHKSFAEENKVKLVKVISPHAKIFISSEGEMSDELKPYQIKIPYEKMHDVLSEATLFFGEGASMASEAAMLGTPAVYVKDLWAGDTNDETRAGLMYSYKIDEESQTESIGKAVELLKNPQLKAETKQKQQEFLETKIDPVAFLTWFIENYPESKKIMIDNPDYQYRFGSPSAKAVPLTGGVFCDKQHSPTDNRQGMTGALGFFRG